MSDRELRNLERRYLETRDPADAERYLQAARRGGAPEVSLLRARVLTGDLPRERLALAAHLGHASAAAALDEELPVEEDLERWTAALAAYDEEASVRAGLAAARVALAEWEAARPGDTAARALVEAAEAYARCPCAVHAEAASGCRRRARRSWQSPPQAPALERPTDRQRRLEATLEAVESLVRRAYGGLFDRPTADELASFVVLGAAGAPGPYPHEAAVRAALRAALLPWALGEGDPLLA